VLGLPALREEIATQWSATYGGVIKPRRSRSPKGCNQAFCTVMATLAGPGDEVILTTPWYFNHKMWLDMASVTTVPLETDATLIPSAEQAAGLITDRTRAIVLVSPNNPGGVEYPAETCWRPSATCAGQRAWR
jgi:aspartate/methionine/tyrosine aminotransferase